MTTTNITVWPALGLEVTADRTRTWFARAAWDGDGMAVLELLDPVDGSASVPQVVTAWRAAWRIQAVAVDPNSPSATTVAPMKAVGLRLKLADAHGMAVAHGRFQDMLTGGRLRVRGHGALDDAARLAQERRLAGAHAVDRYAPADLAPLIAAELAVWALDDGASYDVLQSGW